MWCIFVICLINYSLLLLNKSACGAFACLSFHFDSMLRCLSWLNAGQSTKKDINLVHKKLEHNSLLRYKPLVCSGYDHLSFSLMVPRRELKHFLPALHFSVSCWKCKLCLPCVDVQGMALQCPDLLVTTGKESCLHTVLCTPLALRENVSSAAGQARCFVNIGLQSPMLSIWHLSQY